MRALASGSYDRSGVVDWSAARRARDQVLDLFGRSAFAARMEGLAEAIAAENHWHAHKTEAECRAAERWANTPRSVKRWIAERCPPELRVRIGPPVRRTRTSTGGYVPKHEQWRWSLLHADGVQRWHPMSHLRWLIVEWELSRTVTVAGAARRATWGVSTGRGRRDGGTTRRHVTAMLRRSPATAKRAAAFWGRCPVDEVGGPPQCQCGGAEHVGLVWSEQLGYRVDWVPGRPASDRRGQPIYVRSQRSSGRGAGKTLERARDLVGLGEPEPPAGLRRARRNYAVRWFDFTRLQASEIEQRRAAGQRAGDRPAWHGRCPWGCGRQSLASRPAEGQDAPCRHVQDQCILSALRTRDGDSASVADPGNPQPTLAPTSAPYEPRTVSGSGEILTGYQTPWIPFAQRAREDSPRAQRTEPIDRPGPRASAPEPPRGGGRAWASWGPSEPPPVADTFAAGDRCWAPLRDLVAAVVELDRWRELRAGLVELRRAGRAAARRREEARRARRLERQMRWIQGVEVVDLADADPVLRQVLDRVRRAQLARMVEVHEQERRAGVSGAAAQASAVVSPEPAPVEGEGIMFSDGTQQAQACATLLALVRRENLWAAEGPTRRALELHKAGGGVLSSGEAAMLSLAFDVWNGRGWMTFGRIMQVLDNANLEAVGTLCTAIAQGTDAIDGWIELYGPTPVHVLRRNADGTEARP